MLVEGIFEKQIQVNNKYNPVLILVNQKLSPTSLNLKQIWKNQQLSNN